ARPADRHRQPLRRHGHRCARRDPGAVASRPLGGGARSIRRARASAETFAKRESFKKRCRGSADDTGESRQPMWSHYFVAAQRHLMRRPAYFAINLLGLAVGLAACLLIALYVHDLAAFAGDRRRKEIGVRKVLGASKAR